MAEVVQTTNTEKNYVLGFKCLERRKGKKVYTMIPTQRKYNSFQKKKQTNKKTTTKETKNKPKPNMKQITKSRKRTK